MVFATYMQAYVLAYLVSNIKFFYNILNKIYEKLFYEKLKLKNTHKII